MDSRNKDQKFNKVQLSKEEMKEMSMEINSVVLGGNLARDVELKDTPTGRKVCTLVVASNRTYLSNGNKVKETAFVDVEVWGVTAENCSRYLKKGSPVVVVGRLKQDQWQTPNGEKRSRLKVLASQVQFLPSPNRDQGENREQVEAAAVSVSDKIAWDESEQMENEK